MNEFEEQMEGKSTLWKMRVIAEKMAEKETAGVISGYISASGLTLEDIEICAAASGYLGLPANSPARDIVSNAAAARLTKERDNLKRESTAASELLQGMFSRNYIYPHCESVTNITSEAIQKIARAEELYESAYKYAMLVGVEVNNG